MCRGDQLATLGGAVDVPEDFIVFFVTEANYLALTDVAGSYFTTVLDEVARLKKDQSIQSVVQEVTKEVPKEKTDFWINRKIRQAFQTPDPISKCQEAIPIASEGKFILLYSLSHSTIIITI
jgi:hypothetical protein